MTKPMATLWCIFDENDLNVPFVIEGTIASRMLQAISRFDLPDLENGSMPLSPLRKFGKYWR